LKWGARIVPRRQDDHRLLVRAGAVSATVAEFLAHTPLIFHDRDGLSALCAESTGTLALPPASGLQRIYLARTGQPWGAREIAPAGLTHPQAEKAPVPSPR
jgi:hypothetical protein